MLSKFYNIKNLKGDFTGGLVAGVVALPLALAFGVQSGMGATAGLYGAIAVGIFAALFGGTQTQASGPTGPMTVVSATLVAVAIEMTGSIENAMPIILLSFLLGGLFQVIFGFLNIASYVKYFPYPVVSGFMSGVGLIIVILQLFPFAGLGSSKSTIAVIQNFSQLFTDANLYALMLGGITILIYFIFPKITKAIPSALVALIAATLIAYFFKIDVPLIGEIPSGLPSFQLGDILEVDASAYGTIIEYAVVLAVLGSIDSLLTSVIADNMTKTKHNSNRELIGQGIGNMIAAAIGGIPGAGATKGTVVNINAGGTSKLSGVLHGFFLLAVLLGLGQLAAHIPLCVLACLLFMKKSGDISEQGLEVGAVADIDGNKPWQDEKEFYEAYKDKVIIKHLYGSLFFGFTSYFKDQISALPDEVKAVIFRMDRVPYMDQSGLYALEDIVFDLREEGIEVLLVGLKAQPKDMLEAVDIVPDLVPEDDVFEDIDAAFDYLRAKLKG